MQQTDRCEKPCTLLQGKMVYASVVPVPGVQNPLIIVFDFVAK